MAKPLTPEQINALTLATKNVDRLTRLQVFTLATSGLIDVSEGKFVVTPKAERALARHLRAANLEQNVPVVLNAALEVLNTPDAMCNHRQIWEAAGRDQFERDDVLDALRVLREEGVLETVKLSGNNFQVFWRRGAAAPALPQPAEQPPEVIEVIEVSEVPEA